MTLRAGKSADDTDQELAFCTKVASEFDTHIYISKKASST